MNYSEFCVNDERKYFTQNDDQKPFVLDKLKLGEMFKW